MARVLPFTYSASYRRWLAFVEETGLGLEEVRSVNAVTAIDWQRKVMVLGDREVPLSQRARLILSDQLREVGDLW